jgi:hypothetical protein
MIEISILGWCENTIYEEIGLHNDLFLLGRIMFFGLSLSSISKNTTFRKLDLFPSSDKIMTALLCRVL